MKTPSRPHVHDDVIHVHHRLSNVTGQISKWSIWFYWSPCRSRSLNFPFLWFASSRVALDPDFRCSTSACFPHQGCLHHASIMPPSCLRPVLVWFQFWSVPYISSVKIVSLVTRNNSFNYVWSCSPSKALSWTLIKMRCVHWLTDFCTYRGLQDQT